MEGQIRMMEVTTELGKSLSSFHGDCIDSVTVVYDMNGKPFSAVKHGGSGGHNSAKIKLQFPDEFLTSVSGHDSPMVRGGSHIIRSVTFKSNRSTYGPFGIEEGPHFLYLWKELRL